MLFKCKDVQHTKTRPNAALGLYSSQQVDFTLHSVLGGGADVPQGGEEAPEHGLHRDEDHQDSHARQAGRPDQVEQQQHHDQRLQGGQPQEVQELGHLDTET